MNLNGYLSNELANTAFVHGCFLFQAKLFIEASIFKSEAIK